MKRITRYITLACLILFAVLLYMQIEIDQAALRAAVVYIAAIGLVNMYTKLLSVVNPQSMVADEEDDEVEETPPPAPQEEKREKSAAELAG